MNSSPSPNQPAQAAEFVTSDMQPTTEGAVEVLRSTALAQLNAVDRGIAALRERYQGVVFDVSTSMGMEAAKKARMDIRERRYKLPHIVKEQKGVLKQIAESIDTESERITSALLELETPIHDVIRAEEDRKAEEKAERERKEREAAAKVQADIDGMRNVLLQAVGKTSDEIQSLIDGVRPVNISLEAFGDRAGEAQQVKLQTLDRLSELKNAAQTNEKLQQEMAAQRAELELLNAERQRREERERQERDAAERAQREAQERKQREAEEKLAAERAEFERQQNEAREAQMREQKRLDDERAALEAEREEQRRAEHERQEQARREAEARERQEREQREAAERAERERREAEEAAARAARDRVCAAGPALLAVVKGAFELMGRELLAVELGSEWVSQAEAAMAQAEGNQE